MQANVSKTSKTSCSILVLPMSKTRRVVLLVNSWDIIWILREWINGIIDCWIMDKAISWDDQNSFTLMYNSVTGYHVDNNFMRATKDWYAILPYGMWRIRLSSCSVRGNSSWCVFLLNQYCLQGDRPPFGIHHCCVLRTHSLLSVRFYVL